MGSISSVSLRGVQNISACRSEQVKLHQESNRWEQWIVQLKKNHFDLFIISRLLVRKKKKPNPLNTIKLYLQQPGGRLRNIQKEGVEE